MLKWEEPQRPAVTVLEQGCPVTFSCAGEFPSQLSLYPGSPSQCIWRAQFGSGTLTSTQILLKVSKSVSNLPWTQRCLRVAEPLWWALICPSSEPSLAAARVDVPGPDLWEELWLCYIPVCQRSRGVGKAVCRLFPTLGQLWPNSPLTARPGQHWGSVHHFRHWLPRSGNIKQLLCFGFLFF